MRLFLHFTLAVLSAACGASSFASTVTSRSFHSPALGRDWSYTVYLPTGYRPDAARIPVLYLLHGNNGDANDWISHGHLQSTVDALIEHRDIPPLAVVMPQGGTDWYVDRKEKMETAFFDDLLPEIETHYAVSTQRTGRMIGGVSMGGFGAFDVARLRPSAFCAVGGHSAAMWFTAGSTPPGAFDDAADFAGNDVLGIARRRGRAAWGRAALWLDGGDADPFRSADEALAAALHIRIHHWPGGHDGSYWQAHYRDYLRFYAGALARC
jgi:enterochelin esterase-like enzyme